MSEPLRIEQDPSRDLVTIEGVKYAGELFRGLGNVGFKPGTLIRIEKREDGALTVREFAPGETVVA